MDTNQDSDATIRDNLDANGSLDSNAMFETTTEEQIERATIISRADTYYGTQSVQPRIETLEREEDASARSHDRVRIVSSENATIQEQMKLEMTEIDKVIATVLQTQEDSAVEEWRHERNEAAQSRFERGSQKACKIIQQRVQGATKTSQLEHLVNPPGKPTKDLRRTNYNKIKQQCLEDFEGTEEDEVAWSEHANEQWTERGTPRLGMSTCSDAANEGGDIDDNANANRTPMRAIEQSEDFLSTYDRPSSADRHQSLFGQYLQVPSVNRSLLPTAFIDPDPEKLIGLGHLVRLVRASPPRPHQWRIPRDRGELNTEKDRIYTEYILDDEFLDNINRMLDYIHNWPLEDAKDIMISFQNDPENERRNIEFLEEFGCSRRWTVRIENPDASTYHPRVYSHIYRFPLSRRPNRIDWGLNEYGELPPRCVEEGCGYGCPHERTAIDNKRSLARGRRMQQTEYTSNAMMETFSNLPSGLLAEGPRNDKDREAMPPPPLPRQESSWTGQNFHSNTEVLPSIAENVSKLSQDPPVCPPSPRPRLEKFNLNDEQRKKVGVIHSPRTTTLSPTLTPKLAPTPQPKYTYIREIINSKKRYYAKCLPPLATQATQATHLMPERKALSAPTMSAQNAIDHYREDLARILKRHQTQQCPQVEPWQIDPDRH
jgi:hypothetical protein